MSDTPLNAPPSLKVIEGDVEADAQQTLQSLFVGEPGEFERRMARKEHRATLRPISGPSCDDPAG